MIRCVVRIFRFCGRSRYFIEISFRNGLPFFAGILPEISPHSSYSTLGGRNGISRYSNFGRYFSRKKGIFKKASGFFRMRRDKYGIFSGVNRDGLLWEWKIFFPRSEKKWNVFDHHSWTDTRCALWDCPGIFFCREELFSRVIASRFCISGR